MFGYSNRSMQKRSGSVARSFESSRHLAPSNSAQRSGNVRVIHLVQAWFYSMSMRPWTRMRPFTSICPGPRAPRLPSARSVTSTSSGAVGAWICQ